MMKMMKMLSMVMSVNSQMIPGSQVDSSGHGCMLDGGYQWCEDLNACVRPWENPCPYVIHHPVDPVVDPVVDHVDECFAPCPPPFPCAMPAVSPYQTSCNLISVNDNCGCQTRCPYFDCNNDNCNSDIDCHENQFCRPMNSRLPMANGRRGVQGSLSECVDKVGINESCGGYTPPEFQTRCLDNLECVNTMGPMIADAPGQCKVRCNQRDENGECLVTPSIPDNCATWFDGCNTCQVTKGVADICTLMFCFTQNPAYCMNYHINRLEIGDVCNRFCEDGHLEPVNRIDDCPRNTLCKSISYEHDGISYDTCDDRSWTCVSIGH